MARRKRRQPNINQTGNYQDLLRQFLADNDNANRILKLGNLGRPGGAEQLAVSEQALAVSRTALLNFVFQNPQYASQLAIDLAGLNSRPI